MGTIKVTFYNNNKLTVNGIPSNDNSGIYFQPTVDIDNGLPAHIVHNGHFYTYGSYVIDEKLSDNIDYTDSYVITNIISNQYAKTLTVHKQKLDLSGLEQRIGKVETDFNTLCKSKSSLQLGNDYFITIQTVGGQFHLSSEVMTTPTCSLKLNGSSKYNSYTLSPFTAKLQITDITLGAKVDTITFNNGAGVNNDLFTVSDDKKTITIPNELKNNVWVDAKNNSVEFTITVDLTRATDKDTTIANNSLVFKCTINKATPSVQHNDLYNLTDARIGNGIDTNTMCRPITPTDPDISYTVTSSDSYFEIVNNTSFRFKGGITTYNFNDTNNIFNITYTINTKDTDIYSSNISGIITGSVTPSKWSVKFNPNGGKIGTSSSEVTYYAFYNTAIKTIYPTDPTKAADGNTTFTFDGWYTSATNGTKCDNLKIGDDSNLSWGNNHSTTVYAQWTETITTKYYWYVGKENPADLDESFNPEGVDGWTECTSQKQTPIIISKQNADYSTNIWYIAAPYDWGYTLYNATGAASDEAGFNISTVTLGGVKYKVWTSKNARYQAVGQLIIK